MQKILFHALDISATLALLYGAYLIHPAVFYIALAACFGGIANEIKKSI